MLTNSYFTPHPPIIIDKIGGENTKECSDTIKSMEKIAGGIESDDPDTIIFISPHGDLREDAYTISATRKLTGNMAQFDAPEISFDLEGDADLVDEIIESATEEDVNIAGLVHEDGKYFIDHGLMVPLYFIKDSLSHSTKFIEIGYSMLSKKSHLKFAKIIDKAIEKSRKIITVIASGDLSHKIFTHPKQGKKFDNFIKEKLQDQKFRDIINLEEETRILAGECGYRSLLLLLGITEKHNPKTEVLSYEAPFGVGYLVAKFAVEK